MSAGKKKWGFGGKAPQGPFHTSQEDVSCTCSHPLSLLKSKKLCPIFHHTQNVTRGAPRGAPPPLKRLNDSAVSSNFKKVGSLIVITLPKPHTQPRMPVDTPVALMLSYDLVMLISRH